MNKQKLDNIIKELNNNLSITGIYKEPQINRELLVRILEAILEETKKKCECFHKTGEGFVCGCECHNFIQR